MDSLKPHLPSSSHLEAPFSPRKPHRPNPASPRRNPHLLPIIAALAKSAILEAHHLAIQAGYLRSAPSASLTISAATLLSLIIEDAVCVVEEAKEPGSRSEQVDLISTLLKCLSSIPREEKLTIGQALYLKMLHNTALHSILVGLVNSPAQTKILTPSIHPNCGSQSCCLSAKRVAEDLLALNGELNKIKGIINELSPFNIWKTFRSLLLSGRSPIKDDHLQYLLDTLVKSPNFQFSLNYLKLALNKDKPIMAYSLLMRHKEEAITEMEASIQKSEELWEALAQSLENGLCLEVKLRMAKELAPLSTSSFAQSLCSSEIAFSLSPNPIKVCLLFHEVLGLLKPHFTILQDPLTQKQEATIRLCGFFLQEIEKHAELGSILHDTDLERREVIALMKHHPQLLLQIETFIQREWQGPLYLLSPDTLSLSTLFSLIASDLSFNSIIPCKWGYWRRLNEVATPLQFHFFRHSPLLKYLEQFVAFTLIACMLTVVGYWSLTGFKRVQSVYFFQPVPGAFQEAQNGLYYMRVLALVFWPLGGTYALQDLLDFLYNRVSHQRIPHHKCELVIDMAILLSIVLLLFTYNLSLLQFKEKTPFDYFLTMASLDLGNDVPEMSFLALGVALQIKVLYHFRLNSLFGPLLSIFSHMTRMIVEYCLLLVLLLFPFAFSGRILFSASEFSSLSHTLITLFSWILRVFSFDTMDQEGWRGQVFLALYLVICMVLMMNFLVALLSTAYSELTSYRTGLYLKNMVDEQPRWAHHPRFNLFTYRVPPLNVLTFLAFPCLPRCSSRGSLILEKVQYLPMYFLALALVIGSDLLFLPVAWVFVLKRSWEIRSLRHFMMGVLLFPFVALTICVLDLAAASFKLWDGASFKEHQKRSTQEAQRERNISDQDMTTLKRLLSQNYQDSNQEVPLSEVVREVRDELPFCCSYQESADIVHSFKEQQESKPLELRRSQGEGSGGKKSIHSSPFFKVPQKTSNSVSVSRFEAVKRFLVQNSFQDENGDFWLHPGLLVAVLEQAQDLKVLFSSKVITQCFPHEGTRVESNKIKFLELGKFVEKENQFREAEAPATLKGIVQGHSKRSKYEEQEVELELSRLQIVGRNESEDSLALP